MYKTTIFYEWEISLSHLLLFIGNKCSDDDDWTDILAPILDKFVATHILLVPGMMVVGWWWWNNKISVVDSSYSCYKRFNGFIFSPLSLTFSLRSIFLLSHRISKKRRIFTIISKILNWAASVRNRDMN